MEAGAFGFLGPNGAGKTTTIRHLNGVHQTSKRQLFDQWDELLAATRTNPKKFRLHPWRNDFFDDMTGSEFIKFIAKYRGNAENGRAKELLDRFELDPIRQDQENE